MTTTFKSLGLNDQVLRGVIEAGYTTPTPIQAATIRPALTGKDLTGVAQTGTGKTAAFVLPLLHRLAEGTASVKGRPVRALVVTPTRELALQVEEGVRTYGKHTGLRSAAVFGGVGMGGQLQAFRRGVDIIIATPGRLLDFLGRGDLSLDSVEVLVLDEADRMFDMGFIKDVRKIVARVPQRRQTLLFSATMPPAVQQLAESIQHRPELIEVGERKNPAATVSQTVYPVPQDRKMDLLFHVLDKEPVESVLVFSRTKHRANKISKKLAQQGIATAALHSNRSQNQRQRALADFRDGEVQVLVATDIAARGIDVEGISHVINFDTPNIAEDYIHRIGRTGRAQASGEAVTFVSSDEEAYLRQIEKHTGQRIQRGTYADFDFTASPDAPAATERSSSGGRSHGSNRPSRPQSSKGSRQSNQQGRKSSRGRR